MCLYSCQCFSYCKEYWIQRKCLVLLIQMLMLETDDPATLARLANDLSDIPSIEIKPIAGDEVIGGVIQAVTS